MKNSSLTTRLVTVFVTLAVLAYFGFQTWNYFTRPEMTTAVYSYHAERVLPLSGFVVRDEEVIDCSDALVELTRDEGERVAKGGRVAVIYQSADALDAEGILPGSFSKYGAAYMRALSEKKHAISMMEGGGKHVVNF